MEVAEEPDNLRELLRARNVRLTEPQISALREKIRKMQSRASREERELRLLEKELEDMGEERGLNPQELSRLN